MQQIAEDGNDFPITNMNDLNKCSAHIGWNDPTPDIQHLADDSHDNEPTTTRHRPGCGALKLDHENEAS